MPVRYAPPTPESLLPVAGVSLGAAAGKIKKPKEPPTGGLSSGGGFKPLDFNKLTGSQRRSKKSKARDKGKKQHRRDK